MVAKEVFGVDKLCINLLKQVSSCVVVVVVYLAVIQIQSGDISDSNVWLADSMLQLFCGNKNWVYSQPYLMCTALYTYLRLIAEHNAAHLHGLRQNEVEFCIAMLRNRLGLVECTLAIRRYIA